MLTRHSTLLIAFLVCIAGDLGLTACESTAKDTPSERADADDREADKPAADERDEPKADGPVNLCTKYESCDGCIAGQQHEGKTEGEAETQCALAVTGCWATWDKPIRCGEETFDEKPS